MSITQELYRLGASTRRLNDGSDHLNRSIAAIDELLGRLMIGLDYVHPRPVSEQVAFDAQGKRAIELSYIGYLKVNRAYHLATKTVKVLEAKAAFATEMPGHVIGLLQAPRRVRYRAVEMLPDLVIGLAEQVEDMVGAMDRRCEIANGLVQNLQQIAGPPTTERVEQAAVSATSHRRQTIPAI